MGQIDQWGDYCNTEIEGDGSAEIQTNDSRYISKVQIKYVYRFNVGVGER